MRPAGLFGLEMVEVTKRQEEELEEAELKMLRFPLGVKRMDRMKNEHSSDVLETKLKMVLFVLQARIF